MTDLTYSPAVATATAPLYAKVKHVIPEIEWPVHAPIIVLGHHLHHVVAFGADRNCFEPEMNFASALADVPGNMLP